MNKKLSVFISLVIILFGGFYIYSRIAKAPVQESQTNILPTPSSVMQNSPVPTQSLPTGQAAVNTNQGTDYTSPQSENGGEVAAPNIQAYEVAFDGVSFSPKTQNINVNDYVFFINNSNSDFWLVSNDAGHSILDSGKAIAPGKQFKFQFTKTGTWNFQDKFNSSIAGSIIVQ
jgi:plastocyanin